MGASVGTGAPRNTHKIRTQCGCKYGCKNYESLVTLVQGVPSKKRNIKIIFPDAFFYLTKSYG